MTLEIRECRPSAGKLDARN